MSDIYIPPTMEPVSSQQGNGTFTCPAGKFARVRVQCSGSAYGVPGMPSTATGGDLAVSTADSFNVSFDVWCKAGDTIAGSATAASANTGATARGTCSGSSTVGVTKNSNTIASFACHAVAGHSVGSGTPTSTVSGTAQFYWSSEEFYILT